MRIKLPALLFSSALVLTACEDGPELIFTPFEGEAGPQNGYEPETEIWVQEGDKGFDLEGGKDNVGRAQFCSEEEQTAQIQQMVVQPIIPDVSVGGVPLWTEGGGVVAADDLLGVPADPNVLDGAFCDPTEVYADAFVWGPTQDVIVFFNVETRLVEALMGFQQYLGALTGTFTNEAGEQIEVIAQPRERLKVDGVELDTYAGRTQAPDEPRSWLNNQNVTAVYKMVRETFFNADPFPDDFDCVELQLCDLIFTGQNDSVPQDTFILIQDSGMQIRFSPEGQAFFVYIEPVRSAPFENGATVAFGPAGSQEMDFSFQSDLRQNCTIDLDAQMTWGSFKSACIANGDERALERANYNVDTSRDAVVAEFTGIDLGFVRRTSDFGVFGDGEQPGDEDTLFYVAFSRTLPAAVEEFRALTLGNIYKRNLEAKLRAAVRPTATATAPDPNHPFMTFSLDVPFVDDEPQRIGELLMPNGQSWLPMVVQTVLDAYRDMTPAQKAVVDPQVLSDVALIEPFVDAVLEAFTHGESNNAETFKVFRTTDDLRWSIGYANFVRNNVPYRVQVQYSLNFGAVTFVTVERGYSETDFVINFSNNAHGPGGTYWEIWQATIPGNPYGLGGTGMSVVGFDRQLDTLSVNFDTGIGGPTRLEISGDPIEDLNGYNRQIRGERFEFIPANVLRVYGKESIVLVYVREDGTIGRVNQGLFKGALDLCPGLSISYGDNVPNKLREWAKNVPQSQYLDCEVVFNYSENGNVLDSITSLANRRSFVVVGERAVTASVWE